MFGKKSSKMEPVRYCDWKDGKLVCTAELPVETPEGISTLYCQITITKTGEVSAKYNSFELCRMLLQEREEIARRARKLGIGVTAEKIEKAVMLQV